MAFHAVRPSSLPRRLSIAVAMAGATVSASATINVGNSAELALTVWDPVAQVSYTKDLGIDVTQFFNYAQSDNGYQQFWHVNTTDLAFAQLLAAGTSSSTLYWALTADDVDGGSLPGELNIYTTLTQGLTEGVVNPTYTALINNTAANAVGALQFYSRYLVESNGAPAAVYNTQGTSVDVNGSTFSRKGQSGYFDNDEYWQLTPGFLSSDRTRGIINRVGQSSWFYKLSSADYDDSLPVAVDEFDNLGHDGYWGLAVDPSNGDYVLSYTLQGATLTAMATTASGLARLGFTEYRASIGTAHFVYTPTLEFADYAGLALGTSISAVPEPSRLAMSLAGLAAVGWMARRRRRG